MSTPKYQVGQEVKSTIGFEMSYQCDGQPFKATLVLGESYTITNVRFSEEDGWVYSLSCFAHTDIGVLERYLVLEMPEPTPLWILELDEARGSQINVIYSSAQRLVFDLYAAALAGETRHAQKIMRELGITYQLAVPQSIGDCWWFFCCENLPNELPEYIKSVPVPNVFELVGYGLSKENAEMITNYTPSSPHSFTGQ